ncbi:hypothetical protein IQ256_26905 [cf. Phormidesmis sp. LEGE 11477]|nr:hypothetical protein [cf. Phormidesmis sp. LEGE 11477]
MNLTVEEIKAVCETARTNISEALDQESRRRSGSGVWADIDLSEMQWTATKDIIASELKESGWAITYEDFWGPDGAKIYIQEAGITQLIDNRYKEIAREKWIKAVICAVLFTVIYFPLLRIGARSYVNLLIQYGSGDSAKPAVIDNGDGGR